MVAKDTSTDGPGPVLLQPCVGPMTDPLLLAGQPFFGGYERHDTRVTPQSPPAQRAVPPSPPCLTPTPFGNRLSVGGHGRGCREFGRTTSWQNRGSRQPV